MGTKKNKIKGPNSLVILLQQPLLEDELPSAQEFKESNKFEHLLKALVQLYESAKNDKSKIQELDKRVKSLEQQLKNA